MKSEDRVEKKGQSLVYGKELDMWKVRFTVHDISRVVHDVHTTKNRCWHFTLWIQYILTSMDLLCVDNDARNWVVP